jgi:hypothetical protein
MFGFLPIDHAARLFRLVRLVGACLFETLREYIVGQGGSTLLPQREELGTALSLGSFHHFTFRRLVPGFPSHALCLPLCSSAF